MNITVDETELEYQPTFRFDSENPNWHPTLEYNILFLRAQQNYLNDLYQKRGHLFLNEVYDHLHLPRTGAGAVLGWVYGEGENILLDWEPQEDGSFEITVNPLGVIIDHI